MSEFLGKRVKHDVINAFGMTVVAAHTVLTQEHLTLIKNHRIDPDSLVFESAPESVPDATLETVRHAVKQCKAIFESMRLTHQVPIVEIKKEIIPVVQEISNHANVFQLFQALKAQDDYTYQHNIGVGVISTLIGSWLKLDGPEVSTLSLAATLHDIGKIKVPLEILNKPGKLTREEYAIMKNHTVFGYELLKDTVGVSHRIALVALQHHERADGTGYPFGLKKDKIDPLSQIVAVADTFHAMLSKRPYHEPVPFYEIIKQMRKGIFGVFDPQIVSVFLENIKNKMIRQSVLLTDDRLGEIIFLNPYNEESPVIRVGDEFIDLGKERHVRIKEFVS